jgi:glycine/D-amino acid oxidase-like deaminating enzyme
MKTVIAGNGIVALTAAFRLAQRGGAVAIIGPSSRAGSATLAAPAMLNSFAELDIDTLATDVDRMKFELSRVATLRWDALGAELGGMAALGHGVGTYVLDDGDVAPILAACAEYGEPHAIIDAREVPGYAPVHGVTRAVRLDREGWIDPRRVMAALERALAAAPNVEIIDGVVDHLRSAGGAITGAVLGDGRVVAGTHYLVANGASLSALLAASDLGIAVQRVLYGVGITVELRSARRACLRMQNRSVYLVPCGDDRAVIGATNSVSAVPEPGDPEAPARLVDAATAAFDRALAGCEVVRVNVGWRPISLDTYPLLGATSIANLAIASGTRRDGFHLAPLIAEYLAALLHGEPTDPRLAVFAPERAPLRTLSRASAIAIALRTGAGELAELERLHDAAGADTWGIPPELLPVYRRSR